MAFSISKKEKFGKVTIKDGPQANSRKNPVSNDIGVKVTLDTETGEMDGKISFFSVKTSLTSEKELVEAIEKAINDNFKPEL